MLFNLERFYQACNPSRPLMIENVDDRRYYIDFTSVRGGKIIAALLRTITKISPNMPTCQLFTGHLGCGKSTELLKLKAELEAENFHVVYFESTHVLEMVDIDITDILLAIAGLVSENLEAMNLRVQPSYFTKLFSELVDFLQTPLELGLEAELSVGIAKITAKTKESPQLRRRLRDYLEPRTENILQSINKELLDRANLELKARGKKGLVVIVDNLDRVATRPLPFGRSLPEYLFIDRGEQLRKLNCHIVYTIPLALTFSNDSAELQHRLGGGVAFTKAMWELRKTSTMETESLSDVSTPTIINSILQQLRENADNYLITVLIFDQFEEFFFGYTDINEKQAFDQFISDCLGISFVKVILTLREDYLHRLLDFKYLSSIEAINNNILDKNIRYQLNNFSPENARQIIQKLTERSHYQSQLKLEPDLVDALVADLSSELGEVRPIELQLVGAQLQDKYITTLAQYQPYRSNKLIQTYIKELIKECGQENERAALLVLYLLTDDNNKRPFKTRAELTLELSELEDSSKLELILDILIRSGLVVIFPNVPERYQLIHDYLVSLIRSLQQQESGLQTQINTLRHKVINSYQEIERLKSELRKTQNGVNLEHPLHQQGDNLLTELRELRKQEEKSKIQIETLRAELKEKELTAKLADSQEKQRLSAIRLNIALKIALTASIIAMFGLTTAVITSTDSEMQTLSSSSETLFASQKGINALQESLKAGKKLQKTLWINSFTQEKVLTALYQAVYGVKERNRLEGHLSGVRMVVFSADKSLIASASADTTIHLWNPHGILVKTLSGHEDVVNSVSFSSDSQMLVSASQDKTIKLWSREGKLLKTLLGHTSVVNSVSFDPNSQIIASASTDQTIKLWSKEGKLLKTLTGHKDAVLAVAWSSDGKILASSSADKTIKLWSREGQLLKTLLAHEDAVVAIAWSRDSKILASASLDKKIKLWSREGQLLKTLSGHSSGVLSVNFSPDSQTLASASIDETVKIWSLDGNLLGTLRGHNSWVYNVNFSPDKLTLASAGRDKTIILWRWDSLILRNPQANDDLVTGISFSPDSNTIASASQDTTIKIWNREGKLLKILTGHNDQVWGLAWSPDGKIIASASKDKTIKLWSREGQLLKTLFGHNDTVLAVAWSPDGKMIASASKDKTIKLWNRDGKLLKTLNGHTDAVNWVSFSPNGKFLASASDDKSVKLWTSNGELIKNLTGHIRRVNGVAWSPNSKLLASVSLDSTVKIWDENGQLKQTLMGYGDGFISVNFSPDGKTLAVSSDNKIRLWNQEGVLLMVLKGDAEELSSVSFSPDGKILAAGSGQGHVILRKLSDIKLESLLKSNCNILKDYLRYNPNITRGDRE